jgi:ribonuclease P protein component
MSIHETHVPTEQDQKAEGLRLQKTHGRRKRAPSHQPKKKTRAQAAHHSVSPKKTFPKSSRVLCNRLFQKIMRAGGKISGSHILIHYHARHSEKTRLGITVSKKFGKAHERNRFKRVIREAFRICQHELPKGLDLNILPHGKDKHDIAPKAIAKDLLLLKRS